MSALLSLKEASASVSLGLMDSEGSGPSLMMNSHSFVGCEVSLETVESLESCPRCLVLSSGHWKEEVEALDWKELERGLGFEEMILFVRSEGRQALVPERS